MDGESSSSALVLAQKLCTSVSMLGLGWYLPHAISAESQQHALHAAWAALARSIPGDQPLQQRQALANDRHAAQQTV